MKIIGTKCDKRAEEARGKELFQEMKNAVNSNDLEVTAFILTEYEWKCVKHELFQSVNFYLVDSVTNYKTTESGLHVGGFKGVPIYVTKEV